MQNRGGLKVEKYRALQLFEYQSIDEFKAEGEKRLKKKWRKLILRNHPDSAGRDEELAKVLTKRTKEIRDAYETLKNLLKETNKVKISSNPKFYVHIVDLEEILKIYKGQSKTAMTNSGDTISDIEIYNGKVKVFIKIPIVYFVDGVQYNEIGYVQFTKDKVYKVCMEFQDDTEMRERYLKIKVLDTEKETTMSSNIKAISIRVDVVTIILDIRRIRV